MYPQKIKLSSIQLLVLFLLPLIFLFNMTPFIHQMSYFVTYLTPLNKPLDNLKQIQILNNLQNQKLAFEPNNGQAISNVKFLTRAKGYNIYFTSDRAVFKFTSKGITNVLSMNFVNFNSNTKISAADELESKSNYFIGPNSSSWFSGVANYSRVEYKDIYPGINAIFYGNNNQLEYDFLVSPGSDPDAINLSFEGANKIETDSEGNLIISIGSEIIKFQKPYAYQEINSVRTDIKTEYEVKNNQVNFIVSEYDKNVPLIIDPLLVYSTYLGGSGNEDVSVIDVDQNGYAYIAGQTNSIDFPTTTGVFDEVCDNGGATCNKDIFVTKLNPIGSELIYSTYIGGEGFQEGFGIAVDPSGFAHISGFTNSGDFPTTPAAYDTTQNGFSDVFALKLNQSGSSIIYSTFIGGADTDEARKIDIDSGGNLYVTGITRSQDFPTTTGAFDTEKEPEETDPFVTKLSGDGSNVIYSTFLGGSQTDEGFDIFVNQNNEAFIVGETQSSDYPTTTLAIPTCTALTCSGSNVFLSKLNSSGSSLLYSNHFGGLQNEEGFGVVSEGQFAYVVGSTSSPEFTTTFNSFDTSHNGDIDAFLVKIDTITGSLSYSTFIGGENSDQAFDISLDENSDLFLSGSTISPGFPVTSDALDSTCGTDGLCEAQDGPTSDIYLMKFDKDNFNLIYSTYYGGKDNETALSMVLNSNDIFLTGMIDPLDNSDFSPVFPTTINAFDRVFNGGTESFAIRISLISPIEMVQNLIDTVQSFNFQQGIENSLDAKLQAAQNAIDDMNENNDQAAINSLESFINAVENQRGNQITNEQADILIYAALAIINVLENN